MVLIGVQQPGGGLDALESIGKCLADMRDWALSQDIPSADIKTFTDVPGLLPPGAPILKLNDIFEWIDSRAQDWRPADQLIIYFSGHGMLVAGVPLWLLPLSPERRSEAVDLVVSIADAENSRFGHVVFIGDCCSTVANNEQFENVRGTSILRNPLPHECPPKPMVVDCMEASKPGKASIETVINGVSLSPYTVQLVTALGGTPPEILEPEIAGAFVLRVQKLADELRVSVNAFLLANGIDRYLEPRDKVLSKTQWVAQFPRLSLPPQPPAHPGPPPAQGPLPQGSSGPVSAEAVDIPAGARTGDSVLSPSVEIKLNESREQQKEPEVISSKLKASFRPPPIIASLDHELNGIASGSSSEVRGDNWSSKIPDGIDYETACGFYISGTSVVSAVSRAEVACSVLSAQELRVDSGLMELVSIEFEGGGGVMVPAIAGQIGFLHVERGRLASLAYEPSDNVDPDRKSAYRQGFEQRSSRVRNLRDTLLNIVTGGDLIFTNVEPPTFVNVFKETNYGASVDFSSLLLMAYIAYASRQSKRVMPLLAGYMQNRFGFVPFDLKILLTLSRAEPQANLQFAPPFPMLTLGWSFLQATHESLPADLAELPQHYRNSPWTHFDPFGLALCRSYLEPHQESTAGGKCGSKFFDVTEQGKIVKVLDTSLWFEDLAELDSRQNITSQAYADDVGR